MAIPKRVGSGEVRPLQNYRCFLKIQARIAWVELARVSIARLQRRLTFHLPSGKNSAFSFSASKPDIGPQSNPRARAARMKYAACSEPLRKAFSSIRGLFPTK